MKKQRPEGGSPAGGFAKVAAAVEIEDVRFISFGASFIPEAVEDHALTVHFNVKTKTAADSDRNRIFVFVDFALEATDEAKKASDVKAVVASARIRIEYKVSSSKEFDQRELDSFGQMNGVYNAWPYWREYVQSAIARMQLPTLIVPVFRVAGHRPKQLSKDEKPAAGSARS